MEENKIVKKIIKTLIKILSMIIKLIFNMLWQIFLILVLLITISAIIYSITISDGEYNENDKENIPYVVHQNILSELKNDNIIKTNNGYAYNIDLNKELEKIKSELKNEGTLDRYISEEKQTEILKNFIQAEMKNRYIDLRNAKSIKNDLQDNELQGAIQIHRENSDGTEKVIEYIDNETFEKYIEANDIQVIDFFTLNDDGKLVIPKWSKTVKNNKNIKYNIEKEEIDYMSFVEKYNMPFDFLWALNVIGEDENFANEIAKLTENTKIVITIFEDVNSKITKTSRVNQENGETITSTIKREKCENSVCLTYAQTWLAEIKNEYKNVKYSQKENNSTIEQNNYIYNNSEIKERTERSGNNFITILDKYEKAQNSILSAKSWLYELIESNSNTNKMLDTVEYLIDIYEGKKYETKLIAENAYEEIYLNEYYKEPEEEQVEDIDNTNFLDVAIRCHDYIRNNNFTYKQGNIIPYPNGTNYIDCSSYVSWVLYEYGYKEFKGHQKSSLWFMENSSSKMGWYILKASNAKPGDLLVRAGHIEIFVGDKIGTLGAGSDNQIKSIISYGGCDLNTIISRGKFTMAIRVKKLK